jgi:hypothetical protein
MGLMPAGASNPFTKLDKQTVIGTLKACGSRDPDVLHAQTAQLLAGAKHLKLLGLICMVIGGLFTVTIFMAWFGIPAVLFGWWVGRFGKRNIQTVDAAYAEYLGLGAARAS